MNTNTLDRKLQYGVLPDLVAALEIYEVIGS